MHFRGGSGSAPSSGRIPEKGDERIRNVLIRGDRLAHGRNTGHICRNVLVSGARARDHGYPLCSRFSVRRIPATGKAQAATAPTRPSAEAVCRVGPWRKHCSPFARVIPGRPSGPGSQSRKAHSVISLVGSPLSWPSVSDAGRNLPAAQKPAAIVNCQACRASQAYMSSRCASSIVLWSSPVMCASMPGTLAAGEHGRGQPGPRSRSRRARAGPGLVSRGRRSPTGTVRRPSRPTSPGRPGPCRPGRAGPGTRPLLGCAPRPSPRPRPSAPGPPSGVDSAECCPASARQLSLAAARSVKNSSTSAR